MKVILLLFLSSISLSAQTKGVVKDSLTGKPIPYVNIWVENEINRKANSLCKHLGGKREYRSNF